MDLCFGAAQKRRADRHRARPQRECRRNAPPVANSPGGNHRNVEKIGEARHQRDESDQLTLGIGVIERTAVPAGFESLRDDRVSTGLLRAARIGQACWRSPTTRSLAPSGARRTPVDTAP